MKNSTLLSKKLIAILILLISFSSVFAQPGTNVQKLQKLSEKFKLKWEDENRAAKAFANRNGIPFKFQTDEGILFELQSVKDGQPMYYITENANAAATISTNNLLPGGSSGLNLDGTGITVHEWDGGAVLSSHQEYAGRVVMGDGVTSTHYHATHVAGTMIASGVVSSAKGMAPNANLRAFDWNYDEYEMAIEASKGALFSNHSYGYGRGWVYNNGWSWYGNTSISTQEDYLFGFYDSQAQDWDEIAYDAPYYLIVKSAGNDRGDGPSNPPYPLDGPYDCISHAGLAKNILTVGAVNDIPGGYSGSSSVVMSYFSSWGPADDGRIKPDIVTNGVSLYSSYNTNNTSYASLSGTSMAAPSATGSLVLLQQYYENLNGTGNYMRAATLKALVIETADEAGPNIGPDYMFGWGLMNTERAALKISEDQNINVIDELVLNNGESYTRTVHSNGTEPIKITICWTELPGDPVSTSLDPIDPMLVNDLDLRLTLGGSTFYSWKLDRNNPANAATNNSENNVDNVEVVYIAAPTARDYIVTVDHDGTLSGGSQAFSIIYDGITENVVPVMPVANFNANNTNIFIGETVNFTDISTGNPTTWAWTFSGGTTADANVQNPVVVYNTAGTYDVSLTATNSVGSDTETKTSYITVSVHPPVANFTSDITTVLIAGSINFTDQSTYNPDSWSWSFAGGTPSTSAEQDPVITYSTRGTYEVSLTVTNAGGNDTKTVAGYITVSDGSINYCDSHGNATNEWIRYVGLGNEDKSSTGSGGAGYEDFTGIPTFNLESGTIYNLTLSPGFLGRSTFEYWSVWIDFNIDGDFEDEGEQIFTASKKKSTVEGIITIPSGISGETRMRVSMSGSRIPGSCEIFSLGEVEDYTVQIGEAVPQPPVADFTANTTSVNEGQSVQFTDLSANSPTSWSWTFTGGNPATSTIENPLITYDNEGTYSVTLTATNGLGSDTHTKTGYIVVSKQGSVTYCSSQSSSNALEWISLVEIGSFSNSSGASLYSDYSGMIISMDPGSSNTVTLTPAFTGRDQREFWRIWIDFNIDGDFEDTGETVFIANNKKSAVTGTINIPTGVSGQTRMRITMKNGSSPAPCESFGGGEVEDYTVDFGSGTSSHKSATIQTSVSIDKNSEVSFNAYPNPATDKLHVHFEGWEGKKEIRLFDMTGKNIYLKTVSDKIFEIDVSDYPKGIYLLDVSNGIYRENKRISIQ